MDYRTKVREALRTRCVHLLTKARMLNLPNAGDQENPYPTAIWWCGRTCEALGPDGSSAWPEDCDGAGRTCYEPPVTAGSRPQATDHGHDAGAASAAP